ncbi:MAG: phage holin family protein [Aphanocapsa sp. GSE-SYN-MK-11-07L]|jgi:putative membrane protein|nr:phage holin family protein [Aphanocapsa sp. GSE-SYN-MK-11-07L]
MTAFIITAIVTAISLLIISKLPLGIEIDSIWKAVVAAVVFGVLNAFVKPILFWLTLPITIITVGIFALVLNAIIFAITAWLVDGFELRGGFLSAIFGTIALSIINGLIFWIVPGL